MKRHSNAFISVGGGRLFFLNRTVVKAQAGIEEEERLEFHNRKSFVEDRRDKAYSFQ